jgi:light-regulated signal transduction histidine kinase (bacteriophytochrome)
LLLSVLGVLLVQGVVVLRPALGNIQRGISQLELTKQALQRNSEELGRSNAELEQFAYVASHDLQEPLRMVASYTQLLARRYRGKLDGEADEFIGFAVDGATRMQTLIRDLLSYSRVMTQGHSLQPADARLACDLARRNLQKSIEESGATVSVGPLPTVHADATQLTQLFQNLIGNALKYRNERAPQIRVAAEADDEAWLFSFRTTGSASSRNISSASSRCSNACIHAKNTLAQESAWPFAAGSWNGTAAGSGSSPSPGRGQHFTSRCREPEEAPT